MNLSCVVVDDDGVTAELVKQILEGIPGLDSSTFLDPLTALEHIRETKINILITDLLMPGIDGITLLHEVHNIDPLTHVIMMTSHSTLGRVIDSLGSGALDFVMKPFSKPSELREVVLLSMQRWERWHRILKDTAQKGDA